MRAAVSARSWSWLEPSKTETSVGSAANCAQPTFCSAIQVMPGVRSNGRSVDNCTERWRRLCSADCPPGQTYGAVLLARARNFCPLFGG